jgi:hypothetical protein
MSLTWLKALALLLCYPFMAGSIIMHPMADDPDADTPALVMCLGLLVYAAILACATLAVILEEQYKYLLYIAGAHLLGGAVFLLVILRPGVRRMIRTHIA